MTETLDQIHEPYYVVGWKASEFVKRRGASEGSDLGVPLFKRPDINKSDGPRDFESWSNDDNETWTEGLSSYPTIAQNTTL